MKALTILLLTISSACFGQTKIGNITISDSEAKSYFLYLYQHPDTVSTQNTYLLADAWGMEQNRIINQINSDLGKLSVGKAYSHYHYDAHTDTLYNGEPLETYRLNGMKIPKDLSKVKVTYKSEPALDGDYFLGYLIPRKPSEIDFIKWKVKTTN